MQIFQRYHLRLKLKSYRVLKLSVPCKSYKRLRLIVEEFQRINLAIKIKICTSGMNRTLGATFKDGLNFCLSSIISNSWYEYRKKPSRAAVYTINYYITIFTLCTICKLPSARYNVIFTHVTCNEEA